MKRIAIIALSMLLAAPVFAQNEEGSLDIIKSSDEKVSLSAIDHLGYGFHFVNSEAFTPNKWNSGDFFLNLLKLKIRPVENFGITISADVDWHFFSSKTHAFVLDSGKKVQAADFSKAVIDASAKNNRGRFYYTAFNFPVLLKGYFGKFQIGAGAEASLNLKGSIRYSYDYDDLHFDVSEQKAETNKFSYGFVATASYDGLGVFCKYYPKSSKILPDGSVDLNFFTVCLCLSM